MSKRKGNPRKPTGNVRGIPHSTATPSEANVFQQRVLNAPLLAPPEITSASEQGLILNVDKIGFLGTGLFSGQGGYLITTDDTIYRLPDELANWASDVVSGVLAAGGRRSGVFPTRIEFGRLNDRVYAEML